VPLLAGHCERFKDCAHAFIKKSEHLFIVLKHVTESVSV
jgi:hypothetical protein